MRDAELKNRVKFLMGERRKVWLEISCNADQSFIIRNATYELRKYGNILDSGECTIDNHMIIAMIQPPENGQFNLIYSFEIGGELLKEEVVVTVE